MTVELTQTKELLSFYICETWFYAARKMHPKTMSKLWFRPGFTSPALNQALLT